MLVVFVGGTLTGTGGYNIIMAMMMMMVKQMDIIIGVFIKYIMSYNVCNKSTITLIHATDTGLFTAVLSRSP